MSAGPVTLETLGAAERFDRQLALVKVHWRAVRYFWLEDPDVPAARKLRADLPEEFYIGTGMPGLADIRPSRDGRFRFAEDGLTTVIIPCYDTIPGNLDANPEAHVEHLVDLVAVDLDRPERHWRRRGEALILGSAYLDIAGHEGEPVPVYRNPVSWLKAGGAGVAVLDWEWVPDLLLGFDLIAEDVELGNRFEAALKPEIWVMEAAA